MSFVEILESVDLLPLEEQSEISEIIRKRVIEKKRDKIASEIISADSEFSEGKLTSQSVESIMQDLLK